MKLALRILIVSMILLIALRAYSQPTYIGPYYSDEIELGNAEDGSWLDGYFDWSATTILAEALDSLNEASDDFFEKSVDDTDDITEGTTNLYQDDELTNWIDNATLGADGSITLPVGATFDSLMLTGSPSRISSAYPIQIKPSGDVDDYLEISTLVNNIYLRAVGSSFYWKADGSINIQPQADTDDYIQFSTIGDIPTIGTVGSCDLKITASSGEIDFDDENLSTTGTLGAGLTTLSGNLIIPDAGFIGSVSDTDAIQILANGTVILTQSLLVDGGKGLFGGAGSGNTVLGTAQDLYLTAGRDIYLQAKDPCGVAYTAARIDGGTIGLARMIWGIDGSQPFAQYGIHVGVNTSDDTLISGSSIGADSLPLYRGNKRVILQGKTAALGVFSASSIDGPVGGVTPNTGTFTELVVDSPTFVVNASGYTDRVGIGTATPGEDLEIQSSSPILRLRDTGATASATNAFVEFGGTDAAAWSRTGYIGDGSSGNTTIYLVAEIGDLHLGDSSGIDVLNLQGGNVGIGLTTVDDNYKLIVRRAADINLGVGLQSSELAIAAFNDALSANIPLRFYASEYNLLNGNVGINTTTPVSKLSINGGLHVGGDSDAGDNNLLVDGTITGGAGTFTDLTATGTITVKTKGTATLLVAASNAPADIIAIADYTTDGADDASEINTAIASLTSGVVQLSSGTFTCTTDIAMKANVGLRGMGMGATVLEEELALINDGVGHTMIYFDSTDTDSFVEDLTIDFKDAEPDTFDDHLIGIQTASSSSDIRIERVEVINNSTRPDGGGTASLWEADGILLGSAHSNIRVLYCVIDDMAEDGLDSDGGTNDQFIGNRISNIQESGLQAGDPDYSIIMGNIIFDCTASTVEDGLLVHGTGTAAEGVVIIGNTIRNIGEAAGDVPGMTIESVQHSTITGNTIFDIEGDGLLLSQRAGPPNNALYNVVSQNTFHDITGDAIVEEASKADFNKYSNNVFDNITGSDYVLAGTSSRVAGPRGIYTWWDSTVHGADGYMNSVAGAASIFAADRGFTMPHDGCVISSSVNTLFTAETDTHTSAFLIYEDGVDMGATATIIGDGVADRELELVTFVYGTHEFDAGDVLSVFYDETGTMVLDDTFGCIEVQFYD